MTLTEKDLQQKQQAARTHGIYAFEERGETALTPPKGAYLAELKQKLATSQGRAEYRVELAAALGTIVQMGFSTMQLEAEKGNDIWKGGVIGKLGTYVNSLARLLDHWPPDVEKPKDITNILKGDNE